jgi:hypothetical protein
VQDDRPRPELVDGHREWVVDRIVGKKEETKVIVVYDDKEEDVDDVVDKVGADGKEEKKEQQAVGGAWQSRLRSRPSPSDAAGVRVKGRRKLKRRKGRKEEVAVTMYKVHWQGYGEDEQTWESIDKLANSEEAIDEYERTHPPTQTGALGEDSVALHYLHAWTVCGLGEAELRTALVCG